MATKKFKSLPKKSQKAAFAEMDKDGTRRSKGVSVKKLKKIEERVRLDRKTRKVKLTAPPRSKEASERIAANLLKLAKSADAPFSAKALAGSIRKKK